MAEGYQAYNLPIRVFCSCSLPFIVSEGLVILLGSGQSRGTNLTAHYLDCIQKDWEMLACRQAGTTPHSAPLPGPSQEARTDLDYPFAPSSARMRQGCSTSSCGAASVVGPTV